MAQLPHNLHDIVKDADSEIDTSSPQKVFKQLQNGVLLNQNTQLCKHNEDSDAIDFRLFSKGLTYHGGDWKRCKMKGVEVNELISGKSIEVKTNFKTRKLSPDKTYEVSFLIMMKDRAKGWDKPITLKFQLPNGETEQTTENLSDLETNVWIQLTIGEFHNTSSGMSGDMKISLSSPDAQEKTRLVIREIDITAKE
ncbi:protein PHLOEM PROTEIN 2-LIKE A1-like [Pistacia vera]|uniref:protein PHLOEM PROTEIN 2-LIKE A1-like n=1 Tax=Pistacia vera TaxID=55513 RepID=UPI001263969B|nr:protein PHLOEM PROTEIN 2-LIKE A1-like [Pistacia vera]